MEIQWPLALFTWFTGMGGCLFIFVGINEFTKKSTTSGFIPGIVAGILTIVGGVCSVFHLAHPERILNALSHPTSGIFIEAVLVGCLVIVILIYLICLWRTVQTGVKICAVLGIIFGALLTFMAGHSYIMQAIANWNTELLPLGYLLTALPMGSSLYWAMACRHQPQASKFMAICTLVCGILGIIGGLCYSLIIGARTLADTVFFAWGCILLAGVVPTVLGAVGIKATNASQGLGWASFICAACGALLYRLLMWVSYSVVYGFFNGIS
ncbi:MAG: dimethyl sulfoxide reductase anchor subunit [Eggerthellaceae bacterium]|nr:dimethyl sulfoxide reductase anchor subunit [Eggerthellaceae bacterium]